MNGAAKVYDRASGRWLEEAAPAPRLLGFLYGAGPVRALANRLVTRPWLSQLAAAPARWRVSARRIAPFARAHGVDLDESEPCDWPSFAAFFARRPRPGARPVDPSPEHLIAPADSKVLAYRVRPGLSVDLKGAPYTLGELVGGALPVGGFADGWCLVFRLSLEDFHHYVYQDTGRTRRRVWVPGRLDTVGPASARRPVLARNQRLVSLLETERLGGVCVVAVGALTVGKIVDRGLERFSRGQEQGHFELGGSTLVVLLQPGRALIDPDILDLTSRGVETKVTLGSRIGLIPTAPDRPPEETAGPAARLGQPAGQEPAGAALCREPAAAALGREPAGDRLGESARPGQAPPAAGLNASWLDSDGARGGAAGPKAATLARLRAAGLPVPDFAAVSVAAMREAVAPVWERIAAAVASPDAADAAAAAQSAVADVELGAELAEAIRAHARPDALYAVRSSAAAEDGRERSAAGCYLSRLFVPGPQVGAAVLEVWRSAFAAPALAYARASGRTSLPELLMGVVVQPMVQAAVSGVVFTANPAGPLEEAVVTVGPGAGAAVDGEAGLATYLAYRPRPEPTGSTASTAGAELAQGAGRSAGRGEPAQGAGRSAGRGEPALLISADCPDGAPRLERGQVEELVAWADAAALVVGGPADVEFGIGPDGDVWVLQARPITTLGPGPGAVLDNSNIVESYPGLSRALTASFAGDIYTHVFRALAARLASPTVARERDQALRSMVAWWGGRMYYQISNWYALLTLLPFQRVVVSAWQDMLGVRERAYRAGRSEPWPRRVRVWASVSLAVARAPESVGRLHRRFEEVEREFWRRLGRARGTGDGLEAEAAAAIYDWLARELAPRWDVTLINDAHAFGFTAALTALAKRAGLARPAEAAARLIAQGRPLVSLEPLTARQELARAVRGDPDLLGFLDAFATDAAVRDWLAAGRPHPDFARSVAQFIDRYGDRASGELKLETPTARSHPLTLVRALLGEAAASAADTAAPAAGGPPGQTGPRREDPVSGGEPGGMGASREAPVPGGGSGGIGRAPGGDPGAVFPKRHQRLAGWLARHARAGVAARELSRLDRSRLFGMARELFRLRGVELARLGVLERAEDVTHLTLEEALAAGGPPNARELVQRRRRDLAAYGRLPSYPRLEFAGELVPRSTRGGAGAGGAGGAGARGDAGGGGGAGGAGGSEGAGAGGPRPRRDAGSVLRGEGCSAGVGEGSALVVAGPLPAGAAKGRILVTEATDPGWVFHLASAAGVVSEKGSLLSHTAIVARELGVPFVAGVAGATNLLATGDQVKVDGAAGTVELVVCAPTEPAPASGGAVTARVESVVAGPPAVSGGGRP